MKTNTFYIVITVLLLLFFSNSVSAQSYRKVQNQPNADQRLYHFGLFVGLHAQDMALKNTGHTSPDGEVWFGDIPSYSPGVTVGIMADRYLSQYFNLRVSPALHIGEKKYLFREQSTGKKYNITTKNNYISVPIHLKFSGSRIHNARPYLLAGPYVNMSLNNDKDKAIRMKKMDYGLEFGIGCNIYLPLFKLCPELRFTLGLADLVDTDKSDITDLDIMKYRDALGSGKTRMISLIFNFE